MKPRFLPLLLSLLFAGAQFARACSVCGCSLASDWGLQDFAAAPGAILGLRYEYFDQTDLRTGTGSADTGSITFPNDEEIQLSTTNRNVQLLIDDTLNRQWAVSVQLPAINRDHRTIAEGDTDVSTSHASGLGDARVWLRHQLKNSLANSWALQFGLKLPTGRFDQHFASGPQAGELLDRGLQLGTGTTDLLADVAWFGRPQANWGLFAQALLDQPLAERAGFAPSASLTFNGGLRWLNSGYFTPQLQLNIRYEGREHGVNADHANSGGTVALLSPGVTVEFTTRIKAYAFVQVPVYQRWNGLQLQPRALFITGLTCPW